MNRVMLGCVLCSFTCASSVAATLSQNFTFGQASESFATPFNLVQFDPAMGTLTSISFQLAGTQISSATVTDSSQSGSVSFLSSSDFFINDGIFNFFDEVLPATPVIATVAAGGSHAFTVTSQQTATTTYSQASNSSSFFPLSFYDGNGAPSNPLSANEFVGSGVVGLFFQGIDVSTAGQGSAISGNSLVATGGSTIAITYTFNSSSIVPTPEPGTFGMLGLAAAAGFVALRNRQHFTLSQE